MLKTTKPPLKPLRCDDFLNVKYWTERSFEDAIREGLGETNRLSMKKHKAGCPRKSSDADEESSNSYPYLETADGGPLLSDVFTAMNGKLRHLFELLVVANLAPPTWRSATETAHEFVHLEMGHAFEVFRLCEGGWKLHKYITIKYSGFTRAQRQQQDDDDGKWQKRRKQQSTEELDDEEEDSATPDNPPTPIDNLHNVCQVGDPMDVDLNLQEGTTGHWQHPATEGNEDDTGNRAEAAPNVTDTMEEDVLGEATSAADREGENAMGREAESGAERGAASAADRDEEARPPPPKPSAPVPDPL
jgi:hypothetical protein